MKKTLSVLLALLMVFMMVVGCSKDEAPTAPEVSTTTVAEKPAEPAKPAETPAPAPAPAPAAKAEEPAAEPEDEVVVFEGNYTYNDSVGQMATNWNPHTYQTQDDSYPADNGFIFYLSKLLTIFCTVL